MPPSVSHASRRSRGWTGRIVTAAPNAIEDEEWNDGDWEPKRGADEYLLDWLGAIEKASENMDEGIWEPILVAERRQ